MKFAVLLSLVAAGTVFGQDVTVETSTSKTAAEANRAAQQKLEAERKAKKALEESPITYSGFLVELSRAENKSRFLSLRQPVNPKNDYKYVHIDERASRSKAVVLFSLDF
jgi:hypothetical protein